MTDLDVALLEVERARPAMTEGERTVVARELGLSATRYAQRLNRLLDDPAAAAAYPMLVSRLRRLRARHSRRRR
jgi:hypothetical protein